MALTFVLLWSVVPLLVRLSGQCDIQESSDHSSESLLLHSLRCYNDYKSTVHCKWQKPNTSAVQPWFLTRAGGREPCKLLDDADDRITARCKYETPVFAIGVKHTVIFLSDQTESPCSVILRNVSLVQHMRARAPLTLSSHEMGDGGWRLEWSSPYAPSSILNEKLNFQLSYKPWTQEHWTIETLMETSRTLERLIAGHKYEARVRAHAGVGQWSHWSPVVTWQTKEDYRQIPKLHCVLEGVEEVMCSWEVSRALASIVNYQLECHDAAGSQRCCVNPWVSPELDGKTRYSCTLTVAEPEHLQLKLLPSHRAKTFRAHQHIQPNPPQQVKVKEKNGNWIVEWINGPASSELTLWHQICYYQTLRPTSSVLVNVSEGSTSALIAGTSLTPLQEYQVKVRSLVVPGGGYSYGGIPSDWTHPVNWTSNKGTWSVSALIYVALCIFVAIIFMTLYCTIPACHRRIHLWKDSVPSPGKSKTLSNVKGHSYQPNIESEKTCICKVEHLHGHSMGSSQALLWSSRSMALSLDESKDDLHPPADQVTGLSTSGFSGPYILCQVSGSTPTSVNKQSHQRHQCAPSDLAPHLFNESLPFHGGTYVWLPDKGASRSTGDLSRGGQGNSNPEQCKSAEKDQHLPETTPYVRSDELPCWGEPIFRDQPPEYTPASASAWPGEGSGAQDSGYCHLPANFIAPNISEGRWF